MTAKVKFSFSVSAWTVPIAALLTAMPFIGCSSKKESSSAKATRMLEEASDQRDGLRLLTLVDSLSKAGDISAGESHFWQGMAHYRKGDLSLAEFYWQEAVNITLTSTDATDLAYYAKSASYLSSKYCRYGEFALALQTSLPAVKRLEQLECDTTSDYTNLLIFTGCCKAHFDKNDPTVDELFEHAWQMHNETIRAKATKDAYHDAVAGLINIVYGWNSEGEYEKALLWADRFGQYLAEYRERFADDEKYIDKQWGRYKVFRATALAGLGRFDEADSDYADYQQTRFSKSMEGITNSSDFFTVARRWNEAVACYRNITEYLYSNNAMYSLENIQRYMLKKYRANAMTGNNDSTNIAARQICEVLDSAIMHARRNDADGLQAIHKKDTEILKQEIRSAELRRINFIILILVLLVAFTIYTIYRHRMQWNLAQYNAQLEQNNQLLIVANARAEESAKMKTNFIQQISHEIRTPLNILSGFTQIVTTPGMELDDETKQDINRQITENTDRITGLVNKMLELSDINSKTVIDRADQVMAVQIAAQAVEASAISMDQHLTFDLQVAPEAEDIMLTTNLTSATRALSLLLDNARKFTLPPEAQQSQKQTEKRAQVVLKVTTEGGQLLFIVEDNGIGIPTAEAEHIFEEFVQLNDYYDGTGIGLTVARSLVRRLGGNILLDISYTQGARFVMSLPN